MSELRRMLEGTWPARVQQAQIVVQLAAALALLADHAWTGRPRQLGPAVFIAIHACFALAAVVAVPVGSFLRHERTREAFGAWRDGAALVFLLAATTLSFAVASVVLSGLDRAVPIVILPYTAASALLADLLAVGAAGVVARRAARVVAAIVLAVALLAAALVLIVFAAAATRGPALIDVGAEWPTLAAPLAVGLVAAIALLVARR